MPSSKHKRKSSYAINEVKVLFDRLVQFVDCFNNSAQIQHTLAYLKGSSSDLLAKSVEPIAIKILDVQRVRALQHFLTGSNWDPKLLLKKPWEKIGPKLYSQNGMITIHSSENPKKGKESVGVGRQYCGNTGKIDSCQSDVYLNDANEQSYSLLDCQLFVLEHCFPRNTNNAGRELTFLLIWSFKTKKKLL